MAETDGDTAPRLGPFASDYASRQAVVEESEERIKIAKKDHRLKCDMIE